MAEKNGLDDIRKALKDLNFSDEEIKSYIKDDEDISKGEGEGKDGSDAKDHEEEENEVEKAFKSKKKEYKDLKKAMKLKKAELNKMRESYSSKEGKDKDEGKEKDGKGKDCNKGLEDDLGHSKKNKEKDNLILKSLQGENDELKKSVSDLSETISGMKGILEKIANTPLGMKSNNIRPNFFSKGIEVDDKTGEKTISLSSNRDELVKSLEDSLDSMKEDDIRKGMYESAILEVNGGEGAPSLAVAKDLYKEKKIRIVK